MRKGDFVNSKERIMRRAALELRDGEIVNLGFGMPMGVMDYVSKDKNIIFQAENGCLLYGSTPKLGQQDSDIGNSGSMPLTLKPGASVFDLATSFGIIRGGHVDTTVLGALEVDKTGGIANWNMPGRSPGMGGAMDLVAGKKRMIAILLHTDKHGNSKILNECTLPLTGKKAIDLIITEKAVFSVEENGLVLTEIVEDCSLEEIKKITEADFVVSEKLCTYRIQ